MVQLEHKQTVILGFGLGDDIQNDIWQLKFVDMETIEWQQITYEWDIPEKRMSSAVAIQQDQEMIQIHGGQGEGAKQLADA